MEADFAAMQISGRPSTDPAGLPDAIASLLRAVAAGDLHRAWDAAGRADVALVAAGAAPLPAPRRAAAALICPDNPHAAALSLDLDRAGGAVPGDTSIDMILGALAGLGWDAAPASAPDSAPDLSTLVAEMHAYAAVDFAAGDSAVGCRVPVADGLFAGRIPPERLAAQLAFDGADGAPWAAVALVVRDDASPALGLIAAMIMAGGDAAAAATAFGDWSLAAEVLAEKFLRISQ